MQRRHLMVAGAAAGLATAWPASRAANPDALALLRTGGVVLAMRHALAPGTFDPPNFELGNCATQRNLSDEGRDQARRIGAALKAKGLVPARVRSSPWCRCVDTAQLAFGSAEAWSALGSPRGYTESTNEAHLAQLRTALSEAKAKPGRFEVWVTHMFVLSALVDTNTTSGEGLVLRAAPGGRIEVLARLPPA